MLERFLDTDISRREFSAFCLVFGGGSLLLGSVGKYFYEQWSRKELDSYQMALEEIDDDTRKARDRFRILANKFFRPDQSPNFWQVANEDLSFNKRLFPYRFNISQDAYSFNLSTTAYPAISDIKFIQIIQNKRVFQETAEFYYDEAHQITLAPISVQNKDFSVNAMLAEQQRALINAPIAAQIILRQAPDSLIPAQIQLQFTTGMGSPDLSLAEKVAELPRAKYTWSALPLNKLRVRVDYP